MIGHSTNTRFLGNFIWNDHKCKLTNKSCHLIDKHMWHMFHSGELVYFDSCHPGKIFWAVLIFSDISDFIRCVVINGYLLFIFAEYEILEVHYSLCAPFSIPPGWCSNPSVSWVFGLFHLMILFALGSSSSLAISGVTSAEIK